VGVVQIRVTRETWNPLVGAALATFGATHKPPVLNHVMITDKLRSYAAAKREVLPAVEHRQSRPLNNRAEVSHQPTRRRVHSVRIWTDLVLATRPSQST